MKKIVEDPQLGQITYTKRVSCRSIRIKVGGAGKISVSLPFWVTYATAQQFLEEKRSKILSILSRQTISPAQSADHNTTGANPGEKLGSNPGSTPDSYTPEQLASIRKRAKAELPARLEYQCRRMNAMFPSLSVHYNKVFIKNNRTNWGSCSIKGNINLNMHLVNLPEELSDFVIIHELCHLVHPNHGAQFHKLVDAACGGKEKEYSRQLRKYTHLLRRIPV
jgi:predicted metal-dependent hydrolase